MAIFILPSDDVTYTNAAMDIRLKLVHALI